MANLLIELSLPIKAFSVNATSYRDSRFKTKEYQDWYTKVCELLEDHKELHELADDWRKDGGYFKVDFSFHYPEHIFWNRNKTVSSKTFDLTNCEKNLLDAIFRFMDINDKHVVLLKSSKHPGIGYEIKIKIQILPILPPAA